MLEGRPLCQQGDFFLPSQACITQVCASPVLTLFPMTCWLQIHSPAQ